MGSNWKFTYRPTPSRNELGPNSGSTRYGPDGTPHVPSVSPKSCERFSSPAGVAISISPPSPSTELTATRIKLSAAATPLPCSRLLAKLPTSARFEKKLLTAVRAGSGVTAL
ncbi:hypothetical protein D3C81_1649990 [compost metagenome]